MLHCRINWCKIDGGVFDVSTQVMFGNGFCFLFLKFFFLEYKKNSCIFEIKNMFGQLKLKKKQFFEKKNKKIKKYVVIMI